VSLMEAQQATKIRQSFLAALEEDDYSILPPPVYVRGFIKNYSNYLDLNGQEMVQLFDELLESVAAGYESYPTSGYGSSDSGGAALPPPAINPQMLAGLSQSEARMVERSAEMINLTPLVPTENTRAIESTENEGRLNKARVGLGSADSSAFRSAAQRLSGLRVPEKYVLKPAIPPINKPSFYMPSFVPLLLVLIIVGAALVIAYRGLVVPPVSDPAEQATPIPNVYSKATVTPFAGTEVGDGQAKPTASVASAGITPPPFYTPDQALVAPSAPVKGTATTALSPSPTAEPSATPTVAAQTLKVDVSTSGGPSWLTVTVDGQEKYSKLLPAGQSISFEGKKISIRAGAPGVVKVKVNGQDKQYAPPGSDVITHTWDVNGEDSTTK
jgi:cytoskeletal protein RodZ